MKSCNEMVNSLMERLDAYEVRQKQKRKTVMKITSVACAFAVVAAVGVGLWQGGVFGAETPPVEEPSTGTTTAPTKPDDGPGIGGDGGEDCQVHNYNYHWLAGDFTEEQINSYYDSLGENFDVEEINIVDFVHFYGFTREEFMDYTGVSTEMLDDIAWNHGSGCPYTNRQFIDAIYEDDPALKAWVFASAHTWPQADTWSLSGDEDFLPEDWPPEGYGFGETRPTTETTATEPTTEPTTTETEAPSTTLRDWTGPAIPTRDEFGNTTAPTTMP